MKLILLLLLLPSSLSIPLSDFFPYNRTGTICRASSGDDVTDRLNDGSCETVLFPSTIEAVLTYNTNVDLPFFNETIRTISVRSYHISSCCFNIYAPYRWISMDICHFKVH